VTRIVWSPLAIEDVEAIRAYVARDSPRSADLLVARPAAAVERLEASPLSGRVVPEVGDDALREVIHGNDRIVYRIRADLVEIVTARACFEYGEIALGRTPGLCEVVTPPPLSVHVRNPHEGRAATAR
jgi:plasmid stabilization system protein ParE